MHNTDLTLKIKWGIKRHWLRETRSRGHRRLGCGNHATQETILQPNPAQPSSSSSICIIQRRQSLVFLIFWMVYVYPLKQTIVSRYAIVSLMNSTLKCIFLPRGFENLALALATWWSQEAGYSQLFREKFALLSEGKWRIVNNLLYSITFITQTPHSHY